MMTSDREASEAFEGRQGLRLWLMVSGLAIGLILAATGWWWFTRPYVFHGSVIEPSTRASDIALMDQAGQAFRLSEQTGDVVLVYFGYTFCPDECPTILAELKQVRARLGDQAARVRVVFVTVDPARDTVERLRSYLAAFDPTMIGVTGTLAELRPVWQAYGVYQAVRSDLGAGTTVDHSSRVYVVDTDGDLRLTFSIDMEAAAMAEDVQALLRGR